MRFLINKDTFPYAFTEYMVFVLNKYIRLVVVNKDKNNLGIYLRNVSDVKKIIRFFKKHTQTQHQILTDMFCIDFLKKRDRFNVMYCLLSLRFNNRIMVLRFNNRIMINVHVDEVVKVESIIDTFKSANWLEREIWDLFGVFFYGHVDLRRILTDYGFEGFPLRKDFPLTGFVELRYDDSVKKIVYEPVETTQEFRIFDFESPWENIINLY
jgi:NADH dehydrogenase (ubiquinone) Fe-S protein 3